MDLFPQSLLSPAAEVVVDGLPRRQVMGQQPPSTTGPQPVGHGVDQLAAVMRGGRPRGLGAGMSGASSCHSASVRSVAYGRRGRITGDFLIAI
jgi:hypothetical protein